MVWRWIKAHGGKLWSFAMVMVFMSFMVEDAQKQNYLALCVSTAFVIVFVYQLRNQVIDWIREEDNATN